MELSIEDTLEGQRSHSGRVCVLSAVEVWSMDASDVQQRQSVGLLGRSPGVVLAPAQNRQGSDMCK